MSYFITGTLTQDIEKMRRARLIIILGLLCAVIQAFYAGIYYKIGYSWLGAIVLVTVPIFLAVPFVLKMTKSVMISGNYLMVNGAVIITLGVYGTGNLISVIGIWFCAYPLAAALLMSRGAALGWGCLSCFTLTCFLFLHQSGYAFPEPIALTDGQRDMFEYGMKFGLTLFLTIFFFYYEDILKKNFKQLSNQTLELTSANERLQKEISEHKQTEEALQESEANYKNVLENMYDVFYRANMNGELVFCSPSIVNMFGYDRMDEIIGMDIASTFYQNPRERAALIKEINTYGRVIQYEAVLTRKDGTPVYVETNAHLIFDQDGQRIGLEGVVRDITKRKQAEEALKESVQNKTILLQEVNHRVKNNLAAITGMLLIERKFAEKAGPSRTTASVLNDLVDRVEGLSTVHDLLSASAWSPMPLNLIARKVTDAAFKALPSDSQVEMKVSDDLAVMLLPKQAHHMTIVINELATNVIKYAASAKKKSQVIVRIVQEPDKDEVLFEFRDNGPGFSKKALSPEGGNVGIYLMKNTVRHSLNGKIAFHNDHGAVVTIRFKRET